MRTRSTRTARWHMTAGVNGASSWPLGTGRRILVTGGSGLIGRSVVHALLERSETPAVIVDISAARALGYEPAHDLNSGLATVWPEFEPGGGGQSSPFGGTGGTS